MYKKKYEKGEVIQDFNELAYNLTIDNWIYYRHKPYHPGWVLNWSFRFIAIAISRGQLFIAKKIK